jgi:arylamine N-acetyltransferase
MHGGHDHRRGAVLNESATTVAVLRSWWEAVAGVLDLSTERRARMFASLPPLDDAVRVAYLARLGVEAGSPSVESMFTLVRRHAERVPYETMWIHSGELWGIDPVESARRIALAGRGGYCYHLNGALGLLLRSLGYDVHGHVGGVQVSDGPDPDAVGNHLVLTVAGLPSHSNPSGVWYVDAGLGDALHEPLPLAPGMYVQGPFRMGLEPVGGAGWHLTHDPLGGFSGMGWTTAPARQADFEERHAWLSTSPDSGFVQVAMAERRDSTGVDVIRGLVLARIGTNAFTAEPLTGKREWFDLLADVFGLHFDASPPGVRDTLWDAVLSAHRRWLEAGGT